MKYHLHKALAAALAALSVAAFAQGFPTEFPEGVEAVVGEQLVQRIQGKAFLGKRADGSRVRYEFKSGSNAFYNSGQNNVSGPWRVAESKICIDAPRMGGCDEARIKGETLFVKRSSTGEVVQYAPD